MTPEITLIIERIRKNVGGVWGDWSDPRGYCKEAYEAIDWLKIALGIPVEKQYQVVDGETYEQYIERIKNEPDET